MYICVCTYVCWCFIITTPILLHTVCILLHTVCILLYTVCILLHTVCILLYIVCILLYTVVEAWCYCASKCSQMIQSIPEHHWTLLSITEHCWASLNIPEHHWTLLSITEHCWAWIHTSLHSVKLYKAQLWHPWPAVTFTLTKVAGVTLVFFLWCIL